MTTIEENLKAIKKQIADFEQKYGRENDSVCLLAASKGQSVEKILHAFQAGQFIFGENYVKEALIKMTALANVPIEWHFIGAIQSNKTRKIAEHFAWVHSIDSIKIARRLNDERPHALPPLNVCIEVNISQAASKSGIAIDEVFPLARYCLSLPQLKLRGLMAIPTLHKTFNLQRGEFHKLFSLFKTLQKEVVFLDTLSMGMSSDFEAAIAEGATIVRMGTAIFGSRN